MKNNRIYIILFVALAGIAAYFYFNNNSSTINKELRDFAVKDTASIDRIFMADRQGGKITLERKSPGSWIANHKFEARQDGINSILTTVASLEVKSPVGKNLYNNTMKLLSSNSVKVELYTKDELLKTFYVGHSTMDNLGTFMYLEGSTVPFIMHIPGFNGYLSPRFFTNENLWKKKSFFVYGPGQIRSITVTDFHSADSSFHVQRRADSAFVVLTGTGKEVEPLQREKVALFLSVFQNVAYEKVEDRMRSSMRDSINEAGPFKKIAVLSTDGNMKELLLYRRPVDLGSMAQDDEFGNTLPFDLDKLYGKLPGDTTWYLCQYYTFDKLLKTPEYFKTPFPDRK
jgi:hypothetical protein